MAQFNFGSNAGNTAATPNFGFSAKPATPTFGSLGNTQPSGSITFGTPIASTAQNTGLNFGAPTQNLAFSSQTPKTTGLAFGTPNLSFGATTPVTSTGLMFGTPTAGATGGLTFGTPASGTTGGLSFGTPAAGTTGGLSFGTPATGTTGGLAFGTPATGTTGGLSFGTPAAGATGGLNFGTPASGTTGGLSFGTPATTTTTGLSFGTPATTSTGLTFGATTTPSTGLTFGTPASTGFSLGGTTTTTTNTGLFGGITPATTTQATLTGLSFGTPASTPSTGFTLGAGTNLSLKPSLGSTNISYGTPTGTTTNAAPSFGLGTATTISSVNFNSGAKTQTTPQLTLGTITTQSTSVGLGGVDSSLQKSGAATTGRVDTITAKENIIPNEILQTIEGFKTFVKDQKGHSSDVSRGSAKPFLKVGQDIDLLMNVLSEVGNELQKNQQVANKLKHDSAKCLQNAEMAQRTNDTPPGLQFENNAPMQYFIDVVNKFEQDLQALRMQIDITDKHIHSLSDTKFLTSQELSLGMRRLHDTFVALAGRLQSVHQQVESQKDQYLNLRKYILKDRTDVFVTPIKNDQIIEKVINVHPMPSVPGPTPFSALGSSNTGMMMMAPQQVPNKPPPAYPTGNTTLSFGAPNTAALSSSLISGNTSMFGGNGTSLFGNTPQIGQTPTTDTSGFQLQNPPLGNKRGKR